MGSIRARSDNDKLFVDFRYRGVRCREQTALLDTPANRKKLEKLLARVEAEIAVGVFDYAAHFPGSPRAAQCALSAPGNDQVPTSESTLTGNVPTFDDFAWEWFDERLVEWKKSHEDTLRGILRQYLIPTFGSSPLHAITKAQILKFRAELAQKPGRGKRERLSEQRINHVMTALRMVLTEAADRFDFTCPFRNIRPLRINREDIQPFSLEEVQTILDTVRPDYRQYLTVRFFTGLRTSEVHGLKWKHVDLERRQIIVREALVRGRCETTKTPESRREIDMSNIVFDALKEQEAATGELSEFVFCNRSGKALDANNFTNRIWYPLLSHLQLTKRRPYQMRHTAATLWLAAGENPQWIARQLGHTTTEMLFRVYARFVPNLTRRDGSAMERLLSSRGFSQGN